VKIRFAVFLAGSMTVAALAFGAAPVRADEGVAMPPHGSTLGGTVRSTMDADRYTYIELTSGDQVIWAAVPHQELKVGDRVQLQGGVPMRQFHSPTLDRSFELIYFAAGATVASGDASQAVNVSGDCPASAVDPASLDFAGIPRAEGGKTIAELFAQRAELAGQQVAVRGKVVKCLSGIMGKNWLHVRDGSSGPEGASELTVTTQGVAGVGSTLLLRGTVGIDKDFDYGYAYDLILEDASLTLE